MRTSTLQLSQLILDQLARGEMRLLALVVAVRKALGVSSYYKGDLLAAVSCAVRKLVCSNAVVDAEGVYSLTPAVVFVLPGLATGFEGKDQP